MYPTSLCCKLRRRRDLRVADGARRAASGKQFRLNFWWHSLLTGKALLSTLFELCPPSPECVPLNNHCASFNQIHPQLCRNSTRNSGELCKGSVVRYAFGFDQRFLCLHPPSSHHTRTCGPSDVDARLLHLHRRKIRQRCGARRYSRVAGRGRGRRRMGRG